jgi:S-DNA-T family DNA segregation ATPase FtsK/SpoIIIE
VVLDDPELPVVEIVRHGPLVTVRVGAGRPRPWRAGVPLAAGRSRLVVRRPGAAPRRGRRAARERATSADGSAGPPQAGPSRRRRPRRSTTPRRTVVLWFVPAAASVGLGVTTHQPWLALSGLLLPAATLLSTPRADGPRWRRQGRALEPPDLAHLAVATALTAGTAADGPSPPGVEPVPGPRPVNVPAPWDPAGCLALVGEPPDVRAAARAVVLGALGSDGAGSLLVRSAEPAAWSWAAWLSDGAARLPAPDEGPALVVHDGPTDASLAAWRAAAPAHHRLLLLARAPADVPSWCTATVAVARAAAVARQPATLTVAHPSATVRVAPAGVSATWADAQARRLAAIRFHAARRDGTPPDLAVALATSLAALPTVPTPDAAAVTRSWSAGARPVPLGVGTAGRPVEVDLRRDGPHALVAGTTGAGKSALLTTLVLAHALAEPPDRLAVLLVDFKGGAGLGPVARLPHVLDHVTDLDATRARRVLVGLAAELRRREAVLARAGATDLRELAAADPATPPRLLVVVDELRALADDVPDALPALARIAAQGRSLGVHLVLATQRPAGAVPADLRANVGLRVCLRVADAADSSDVLDDPSAAAIDAGRPGRALLRVAGGPLVPLQVARATTQADAPVRRASTWRENGWTPPAAARDAGPAPWVDAARAAARHRPAPTTPWLPELPRSVRASDVPPGPGLAVALADLPAEQRRAGVRWEPSTGHLLVVGGPSSGRTTTLVAIASQAARAGRHVHAVGLAPRDVERLRAAVPSSALGSVLAADEPVAVARALELLTASGAPAVLLVDGLDVVLEELADLARGAGSARLVALLRAPTAGLGIAATTPATAAGLRHAGAFRTRLALALPDDAAALVGVPRELSGGTRPPGRAVHLHDGGAAVCQIVLPERAEDTATTGTPGTDDPAGRNPAADSPVARVTPLPRRAQRAAHAAPVARSGPPRAALGIGGDAASAVAVELDVPRLVVGPPGSGRTTALAAFAAGATAAGLVVVHLAPEPGHPSAHRPTSTAAARPGPRRTASPKDAAHLLATHPEAVLLVDDLDELERGDPSVADLVASRDRRLVVATTAQSAVTGFHRAPLAGLLRRRRLLVLDPRDPASAELIGPRAAWLADPRGCPPGRAALVDGRDAVPLQVYA